MKTTKRKYFQGYKKLKNIKMFEQFVNEFDLKDDQEDPIEDAPTPGGYRNHSEADYEITKKDAEKIVAASEENLAPGESAMTDEEFDRAVNDITGLTLADCAEVSYPDEPQEEFDRILKILGKDKVQPTIKTDDGLIGHGEVTN